MEVGSWFDDNLRKIVGDGFNTSFWVDTLVGVVPPSVRYIRLYELIDNRLTTIVVS